MTIDMLTASLARRGATEAELAPDCPLRILVGGQWVEFSAAPSRRTIEDMVYSAAPEQLQLGWPTKQNPLVLASNNYSVQIWREPAGAWIRFLWEPGTIPVTAQPPRPGGSQSSPSVASQVPGASAANSQANNSGSGWDAEVPDAIKRGFNMGAAYYPVLWSFSHNVWYIGIGFAASYGILWPLLLTDRLSVTSFLCANGALKGLIGMYANQIAWKNRQFESPGQFSWVQAQWTKYIRATNFAVRAIFMVTLIALIEFPVLRTAVGSFLKSLR